MTILYGIPNCDTVRKSRAWFDAQSMAYQFHDFKKQGVPAQALDQWIAALGWEALVNKKGATWRKLDAAQQALVVNAASAKALMLREPSVIKRPVVAQGARVSVGFSPDAWTQG
ncbi:MAG: ArsC family reductase [Burkholderiaceae bacterium]